MAWSTLPSYSDGNALTAAQVLAIAANINETAVAKATTAGTYFVSTNPNALVERSIGFASINTSETTTSTSFTDLATVGPSVTASTGPRAIVMHTARMENNTAGQYSASAIDFTGATVNSPNDLYSLRFSSSTNNASLQATHVTVHTMTVGSNTFDMQYRCSGGTSTFVARRLTVLPY